jgi:hypothetical protein
MDSGAESQGDRSALAEPAHLARAGKLWDALALIAARGEPGWTDDGAKFLAATVLGRLALRAPALESLAQLAPDAAAHPEVAALRAALDALPSPVISAETRLRYLRANLDALASRGAVPLRQAEEWRARAERRFEREELRQARDGNMLRRPVGETRPWLWSILRDDAASARALSLARSAESGERAVFPTPLTIEGLDPPWYFVELARASRPNAHGFHQRIFLYHEDETSLIDGLSMSDAPAPLLAEQRVHAFVGPGAFERFLAALRQTKDQLSAGRCIISQDTRPDLAPAARINTAEARAPLALRCFAQEQGAELQRLHAQVRAVYAGRDAVAWGARFGYPQSPSGESDLHRQLDHQNFQGSWPDGPLRVLIPSCRFTTFVHTAAEDLAAAFRRARCDARVLVEPDASTLLASNAHHRAMAEFRPDLVCVINYPRALRKEVVPPEVPYVCWIQDAMGHLFDPAIGAASTDLDFLAGHLYEELYTRFGYPRARTLPAPVAADSHKFHPGPADPALADRFACDIAYVSHQSQSPEDFFAQLVRDNSSNPNTRRILESLWEPAARIVERASVENPVTAAHAAATEAIRAVTSRDPDPREFQLTLHRFLLPVADRILRHQMLGWAAEIAAKRRWKLCLYGKGWERNREFSQFARPAIPHGEALRACYQGARAHLHASINSAVHQRPLECALSGGVPLIRFTRDALDLTEYLALAAVFDRTPDQTHPDWECVSYSTACQPELAALARQRQRLGLDAPALYYKGPGPVHFDERFRDGTLSRLDPCRVYADFSEIAFTSREALEERLVLAIENREWRANASAMISSRAGPELTHDAFVQRLLRLIRASFDGSAAGSHRVAA